MSVSAVVSNTDHHHHTLLSHTLNNSQLFSPLNMPQHALCVRRLVNSFLCCFGRTLVLQWVEREEAVGGSQVVVTVLCSAMSSPVNLHALHMPFFLVVQPRSVLLQRLVHCTLALANSKSDGRTNAVLYYIYRLVLMMRFANTESPRASF